MVMLMGLMLALVLLPACGLLSATPTPTTMPAATSTPTPTADGTALPPSDGHPDVAGVVEKVAPSVVSVITTTAQRGTSTGSGVIFDERGYILTNNHVVEGGSTVEVLLMEDPARRWPVEVLGTDPLTDLAVLRLDPELMPYDLVVTPLGRAEDLRIGEWVVAIGSPVGLLGTVTVGVVSGTGRSITIGETLFDLIQTDAAINPGNSGGPLLNLQGEVIGINTAVQRGSATGSQDIQGIGFAVSMTTAKPVSDQLIANGEVVWPWLGVSVERLTPGLAAELDLSVDRGVLVRTLYPGGPAEGTGIQPLDVIVGLGGEDLTTVTQLQQLLRTKHQVGETIAVRIVRDGQRLSIDVTVGRLPR